MRRYYSSLLIFISILAIGCRKEFPKVSDPANSDRAADFEAVFENFWNGMNNNYIFWDTDPTDWDQVYEHYQPLFAELDIKKEKDAKTAYRYFQEMTATLIDCHFSLTFDPSFKLAAINPSWERKKQRADFHDPIARNFYFTSVFTNYCDLGSRQTGTESGLTAVSATIEDKILYFYLSEFRLTEVQSGSTDNQVKNVLNSFFNLLKYTANIKGVILDLRGNGGGYLSDLNVLIGQMIDARLDIGYTRCKTGDGRLDYSPWIPAYVTPAPGAKKVTAPIVVLGDIFSASMAEMTIIAVKSLPNGYFVGEQTWGAQGPLIDVSAKFNSGIFESSTFFKEVRTSSHALKDKNGKQYEGIGLTPDIEVKHNQQALNAGKDPQLEKAIELIKK
ncbi:MAG: S41 family peptidase [Lentimicrobiaceae bacterium]|nr:S41 family peptidase [Lentimicrobiaceae bacterium]